MSMWMQKSEKTSCVLKSFCLESLRKHFHDSVFTRNEILEETKTIPTKTIAIKSIYFTLFLRITILLLMIVNIYCYINQNKNSYYHIKSQITNQ